jgi:hypothetical protein
MCHQSELSLLGGIAGSEYFWQFNDGNSLPFEARDIEMIASGCEFESSFDTYGSLGESLHDIEHDIASSYL